MIQKIRTGGQTGVDRASLDIALTLKIPYCGWCPKGRLAEDGIIDNRYDYLVETKTSDYSERTKLNVRDSDGTLILIPSSSIQVKDGTNLTYQEALKINKPCQLFNLNESKIEEIILWIKENEIKILNIAGPRESQCPGIYKKSLEVFKPWRFFMFLIRI